MVDQEGWQELSNLYLLEGEYAKSAYCMEEMILHNSQNHLYHQRHADIRYTQVLKPFTIYLFCCLLLFPRSSLSLNVHFHKCSYNF